MSLCQRALNFESNFPKTTHLYEFRYRLFIRLPKIIVVRDFLPSLFKRKRGILPPLTKQVFYLEDYLPYNN